jgi:hypothetical protein
LIPALKGRATFIRPLRGKTAGIKIQIAQPGGFAQKVLQQNQNRERFYERAVKKKVSPKPSKVL